MKLPFHHSVNIFCKLVGDRNKSIICVQTDGKQDQDQTAYVHCTVDYMYLLIIGNLIVCLIQTLGPISNSLSQST